MASMAAEQFTDWGVSPASVRELGRLGDFQQPLPSCLQTGASDGIQPRGAAGGTRRDKAGKGRTVPPTCPESTGPCSGSFTALSSFPTVQSCTSIGFSIFMVNHSRLAHGPVTLSCPATTRKALGGIGACLVPTQVKAGGGSQPPRMLTDTWGFWQDNSRVGYIQTLRRCRGGEGMQQILTERPGRTRHHARCF